MTPGRPPLALVALVGFVVGVALMIPFETTLTRIGGIAAMAVFVVCGLAAIAEPGFLSADAGGDEDQAEGGPQAVLRKRRGGS